MSRQSAEARSEPPDGALASFELRERRVRLWLDIMKAGAILLGAVVAFLAVQQPDSVFRRRASEEELRRERAKLVLEWIREPDAEKKTQALNLIRAVYGEAGHGWLDQVEKQVLARANADAAVSTLKQYEQLLKERDRISAELRQEEVGAGASGRPPGHGPLWAAMRRELGAPTRG